MAEILPTMDWAPSSKHNPLARLRKYPWDEWLDGRIRRLTQGPVEQGGDFDGPAQSLERVIRTSANRRKDENTGKPTRVHIRVESESKAIRMAELTAQFRAGRLTAVKYAAQIADLIETPETVVLQAHTDDARNQPRGVTRSPSARAVKEAKAAGNGPAVAKRPVKAVKLPVKPANVNGNGGKAPARKKLVRA